jgi:predicted permease
MSPSDGSHTPDGSHRSDRSGWFRRPRRTSAPIDPRRVFDEEIAHHIEMRVAHNLARGMDPTEAHAEAWRRFGDPAPVREEVQRIDRRLARRERRVRMLDRSRRALGQGWRSCRRDPAVSIGIVVILSLGIAASATMYTVVDGTLLRPLPFPDDDEIVFLRQAAPGLGDDQFVPINRAAWDHYRSRHGAIVDLGLLSYEARTLTDGGAPARVLTTLTTPNLLGILGSKTVLGRLPSPGAALGERGGEILLSHGFWTTRYGADPSIVGRSVELDQQPVTISGVLAPGQSNLRFDAEVWRLFDASSVPADRTFPAAIARLRPGVAVDEAVRDLAAAVASLAEASPDLFPDDYLTRTRLEPTLVPLQESFVGPVGEVVVPALLGAALVLLLACCANVTSLLIARRETRRQETATRCALGAGRWDLLLDDAAESALCATAAWAAGVALTTLAVPRLAAWAVGSGLPRADMIALRPVTVLFAAAAAATAAVAIIAVSGSRRRTDALMPRQGWSGSAITRGTGSLHFALAAGQVALALVLVNGAALMARSVGNLLAADTGVRAEGVVTFELPLHEEYATYEDVTRFLRRMSEELASIPGVEIVAASDLLPLAGTGGSACLGVETDGRPADAADPCVMVATATPGWTTALGMPGRGGSLSWSDPTGAVISQRLADRLWSGRDPLGMRFRIAGETDTELHVAGVVDVVRNWLPVPPVEAVYVPVHGVAGIDRIPPMTTSSVAMRTVLATPTEVVPEARQRVARLDPRIALTRVRTMADIRREATTPYSLIFGILGWCALASLVLSAVGIYAVVSHIAGQRMKEIAIRIALGGGRREVLGTITGRTYRLAALGVATGLAASLAGTRVLEGMLYSVEPVEPELMASAVAVIALTALAAGWRAVWRATRMHPLEVLKSD